MKKYIILFIIFMFAFIGKINAYISFKAGEIVSYNGIKFYVIKDSDSSDSTLKLLKAEPIRSDEIKDYISSTEVADKIDVNSQYVQMPYYSNDTCVSSGDKTGCSTDYKVSNIKQVVDIWANNYINSGDLVKDSTGYSARLLTLDELVNDFYYERKVGTSDTWYEKTNNTPEFINANYGAYCTMTPNGDSNTDIWRIQYHTVNSDDVAVTSLIRPVITIKKDSIDDYTKIVEYNKIKFYIINDNVKNNTITLLKKEPIKSTEIKDYISSTEIASKVDLHDQYISMPYYENDTCASIENRTGCTTDYKLSNVKQIIDVWVSNYIKSSDLAADSTGYSSRLVLLDELVNDFYYEYKVGTSSTWYEKTENTPNWIESNYGSFWTMTEKDDLNNDVWTVGGGVLHYDDINSRSLVRPVITLKRIAVYGADDNTNKEDSNNVNVPNTFEQKSLIIIVLGFIMLLVGLITYYSVCKVIKERK